MNAEVIEASETLDALEAEIEASVKQAEASFERVGRALRKIRDGRLYRATHDTFEAYCVERWGFTRQRASHLIGAAEVAAGLSTIVDTEYPNNEAHARELAPLKHDPAAMAEVMAEVSAEPGKVTAAKIKAAVRKREPARAGDRVGRGTRLSPDEEAKISRLRKEGKSYREIVTATGLAKTTILDALRRLGVAKPLVRAPESFEAVRQEARYEEKREQINRIGAQLAQGVKFFAVILDKREDWPRWIGFYHRAEPGYFDAATMRKAAANLLEFADVFERERG